MKLNTKKIRKAIKAQGLTIEQAAKKMGFSRQRLQMILKNESARLGAVDNIAKAVGMEPMEILLKGGKK
jgi:transcriptional regulator with XRE-family HTH domain